ncbi:MAG: nucleotidyltransferase domain-containing protein [Phaeodactylibacter sp.]|nr:nucleotidyltransferase domain-containing protein [Phaeodactylibacter sp.]
MTELSGSDLRPPVGEVLRRLQHELYRRYKDQLDEVVLFGSQARGEASADSDIDVVAVLKEGDIDPFLEYPKWAEWVMDVMLDYGELVNLIFTSRRRFESVNSPLYQNIHSEGIVIYGNGDQMASG